MEPQPGIEPEICPYQGHVIPLKLLRRTIPEVVLCGVPHERYQNRKCYYEERYHFHHVPPVNPDITTP